MEKRIGCVILGAEDRNGLSQMLDQIPPELETLVVTRDPGLEELALTRGVAGLRNRRPEWGSSYAVRIGTQYLNHCDGLLFLASRQADIAALKSTVRSWQAAPDRIVSSGPQGPSLFPKRYFTELMTLRGDQDLSSVGKRSGSPGLISGTAKNTTPQGPPAP